MARSPLGRCALPVAAGLLLVVMTVAAYAPVLHAGFIWDDDAYVTANPTLRNLDGLRRIWLEPGSIPQYYPLTFTSFWIEYHLWGLRPFGYHLVNIILHALNALLVWQVFLRLRVPAAWFAAAVFALHPMHVESVAWVTERKNILSGLLALSALLICLRRLAGGSAAATTLTPNPSPKMGEGEPPHSPLPFSERGVGGGGEKATYLAVYVLFLGALLSKSVTCTLPAVLLILAWWKGTLNRRTLCRLVPLGVVGAGMAAMTVWMERHHVGAEGQDWSLSFVERFLVAGRALWFYPRTLLWPHGLTFIYPRWAIDAHAWWQYLFPAAAVAVLACLYATRRWIGKGPSTATLCYAGMLLPALGFFNVYPMRYSFVADHFAYLPSLALIALAAAIGAQLVERAGSASRALSLGGGAAVLLLLGTLTARQCTIYHDLRSLWTDTLSKNPACWMAHNNLAMLLAGEGHRDEAIAHYQEAVRLKPDFAEAHSNLGVALVEQGKIEDSIAQFQDALRWKPDDAQADSNLGNVLQMQGRLAEAVGRYEEALRLQPTNADAHNNLGIALLAQGKRKEAIVHFGEALRLNPNSIQARNNLNNALRPQE